MTKFQLIFTALFIGFIIAGVTAFALYKGKGTEAVLPTITIWGTIPSQVFSEFMGNVNYSRAEPIRIEYIEKKPAQFTQEFVEALARRQGPDAVLIPQELLSRNEDKFTPIAYDTITARQFKDTFIQQAELYLRNNGIIALPFSVDPMVMYWNRDIFTNAGYATYPKFWSEFPDLVTKLTVKDTNSNIQKTAVALGEFRNLTHAREILSTLILQAGNPITQMTTAGLESVIGLDQEANEAALAIKFFTNYADPAQTVYSWNRSLPTSKNAFLGGKLATYFGFASEVNDLKSKNPNLNFDAAPLPQVTGTTKKIGYGQMYGFSIVKTGGQTLGTYKVLQTLLSPTVLASWTKTTYLPPVRRDMIAQGSTDTYLSIFYTSALMSSAWLDPDTSKTTPILQNAVESITSGQSTIPLAIRKVQEQFEQIIRNN